MGSTVGYRLVTPSGDRIGKVCSETGDGFLIACGSLLRRTYHVLPADHAWVEEPTRTLRLTVPRQRLLASPRATRAGAVDDDAFRRYWQAGIIPERL